MRRAAVVAVLAVAAALGGCGDDGGDGSSSARGPEPAPAPAEDAGGDDTATDPCELLTRAEVEAAAGNPVEDGAATVGNVCDWASGPNETSVSVSFLAGAMPDPCRDALEADPANETVEGLGDPAFWSYFPGVGSVVVCTENGQLQVTVTGGLDDPADEARLREAAEDLTAKALDRR